jgi:hypothetical protein
MIQRIKNNSSCTPTIDVYTPTLIIENKLNIVHE